VRQRADDADVLPGQGDELRVVALAEEVSDVLTAG